MDAREMPIEGKKAVGPFCVLRIMKSSRWNSPGPGSRT